MFLGSVDEKAIRKNEVREKRKEKYSIAERKIAEKISDEGREMLRTRDVQPLVTKYKPLTNVARECQRFGISHVGAASFSNALLQDLGLANEENIIDRNKIQREISKFNKNVAETHMKDIRETIEMSECIGPYFDGKRDNTKTFELNDETMQNHPRLKTEDHYSIVFQPNNLYYANITPQGSKAYLSKIGS